MALVDIMVPLNIFDQMTNSNDYLWNHLVRYTMPAVTQWR